MSDSGSDAGSSSGGSSRSGSPTNEEGGKGVKFAEEDQFAGLSRKERKKAEAQLKRDEELVSMQKEAERGQNITGDDDSPFMVTLEQEATNEGSRNISLNKVSVSVQGKTLFRETTVKFSAGSRYGVMGPNGRGKSTLLRLLTARELPVQKSLKMLLVEQEQEIMGGDLTCVEAVVRSHKEQTAFLEEVNILRNLPADKMTDEQLDRLNFLEEELVLMGASQAESKARKILHGLGFIPEWQDRKTASFSGGWRKRIALASAVYIEPDLLMLDEPTNHLDLNAVIWLEQYLVAKYNDKNKRPKALLVVSHDAGFLDGICTHMVAIENFKLNYYRGGFSGFHQQVSQRRAQIDKQYNQLNKLIAQRKREGWTNEKVEKWLHDDTLQGKIDPEILDKRREYKVTFPFKTPAELRDGCIVKLENVDFRYGDEFPILFKDVNCSLWSDSRVTLCGPNGIGKSTILNLMTGLLKPTSGYITVNRQVRIGRYNQHFMDKLPLERTPCDYLVSQGARDEFEARRILGSFGLEGLVHKNMVATLSGGQKARVALAGISCEMPHFLLFDEPTNHLDLESIEALCDAINNFKGGILVVTHDSRLIAETNMNLWIADKLNVHPFKGTLDDYKEHVRTVYADVEDKKDFDRNENKASKAEVKALLKQTGGDMEAVEQIQEEKKKEVAAAADDFFGSLDGKKEKVKKDKSDKKEKKDKKDKKEKSQDDLTSEASPEKKSKKDKTDDLGDALADAASDEKEKKKKEKKDKKDKA